MRSIRFLVLLPVIGSWILLATPAQAVPNKPITTFPPSATGPVARGHATESIQATQVLYDQTDSKGSVATSSQNFSPAAWDGFDDRLADDFVVPAASTWSITKVLVNGIYTNPVNGSTLGPPDSIDVVFYPDSGGLPGAPVASRSGLAPSSGLSTGNFVIPLGSAVSLGTGTYWVSVRTNQNYETHGQWKWLDRTVQSNSAAAWVNPRDEFGTGCTTWTPRAAGCHLDSSEPDQIYQLVGSQALAPTISGFTPTQGPVGATVTITGTSFTGATAVTFSGTAATFTVDSSTQITTTVPAAATRGPIAVTTPSGTATSSTAFKVVPQIASFSPTSGPVGTTVTITGTSFTSVTAVRFGGVSGVRAHFTVDSDTQITATVPSGATTGYIVVFINSVRGSSRPDVFDVTPA